MSASFAPPPPQPVLKRELDRVEKFFEHFGEVSTLAARSFKALFTTRFEPASFVYQIEQLGVRSLGIGAATAIFVGIVMAIQFAFSLEKFGAKDTVGRIVGLSEVRELAPSLTALVVGSRIAAGMAAELGSMAVTEQIDAIRALGADPIKKLVVPRLIASTMVMPVLCALALVLGFGGAMLICAVEFDIPPGFFLRTALGSVNFKDYASGMYKTPFFGAIIAIIGCHFGLITRGGTEGVGQSTTRTVVSISIAILVADFILTKISVIVFPGR